MKANQTARASPPKKRKKRKTRPAAMRARRRRGEGLSGKLTPRSGRRPPGVPSEIADDALHFPVAIACGFCAAAPGDFARAGGFGVGKTAALLGLGKRAFRGGRKHLAG